MKTISTPPSHAVTDVGATLRDEPVIAFSELDLRDRVVAMLLLDQTVTEEQVVLTWKVWQQMRKKGIKEPLWRLLTVFPEVDRERVYAHASRVYGFEEARISRRNAIPLVREFEQRLDPALWRRMVALRVLPVLESERQHTGVAFTVFATHDPMRSEVQALMQQFKLGGYELRYAQEAKILKLLTEAFPHHAPYQHLQTSESGLTTRLEDYVELTVPAGGVHVFFDPPKETGDAEKARSSMLRLFEQALVEAVRMQATDICVLPNADGYVEIFFQVRKQLKPWKGIGAVQSKALLTLIKRDILRMDETPNGEMQKRLIQRWIDGRLVRFRVASLPFSEDLHSESIVIRVLQ